MDGYLLKIIRKYSNKFLHSIAFFPAIIAFVFVLLAILAMELDSAGWGLWLNERVTWLTLKDADTARTVVSTIATGIISLTVFSFSLVMLVMNQAASQMSNRLLDNVISDWKQKLVLSFYIGTVVYSLLLLSNISEAADDKNVPSFSVYLLVFFTILDIFLFVYFLHHITQSFIYQQLIQRLHHQTMRTLNRYIFKMKRVETIAMTLEGQQILANESGYFQGFSAAGLIKLAEKHDFQIQFLHPEGSYILKGTPFLILKGNIDEDCNAKIFSNIDFYYGQEIDKNPYYGFQHLTEAGMKALSPGINDPGTAIMSLNALTDLLAFRMFKDIPNALLDGQGKLRVITRERSFEELFEASVLAIWDYGRKDRLVRKALLQLIEQLKFVDKEEKYKLLLDELRLDVEQEDQSKARSQ
ncbi:DUF2254 domain-containing protein [Pedobacter sp. SYSU D00535]|uniref:DUF2254 domain-containing protein n=1 Tax=Pedobacter sp. SYSU D00535 TaxID=2810308 RepID=UPI001A96C62D|nr:DUF2254 domain-containing protein [Pedobacter sp. SYSU D00535]